MPVSLKCMINKWLHKGQISQEEYDAVIKKLDGHDAEIKGQIIRDVLETVKEQNTIYLARMENRIWNDAIEECIKITEECVWRDAEMLVDMFKELKEQENE